MRTREENLIIARIQASRFHVDYPKAVFPELTNTYPAAIFRLQEFIKAKGMTNSAFEKSIPLANGYINNLKNGAGNIGSEILNKIAIRHDDLNLYWLITGKNTMLTSSKKATP